MLAFKKEKKRRLSLSLSLSLRTHSNRKLPRKCRAGTRVKKKKEPIVLSLLPNVLPLLWLVELIIWV
jgi:hypothetical protein